MVLMSRRFRRCFCVINAAPLVARRAKALMKWKRRGLPLAIRRRRRLLLCRVNTEMCCVAPLRMRIITSQSPLEKGRQISPQRGKRSSSPLNDNGWWRGKGRFWEQRVSTTSTARRAGISLVGISSERRGGFWRERVKSDGGRYTSIARRATKED